MITRKRLDELALKVAGDFIKDAAGEDNLKHFAHALLVAVQGELEIAGFAFKSDPTLVAYSVYHKDHWNQLTTLPLVEE